MGPHFHVSGTHALVVILYVMAFFGAAKLLAMSLPDNKVAQAWLALY
jgi:hypothetical protein